MPQSVIVGREFFHVEDVVVADERGELLAHLFPGESLSKPRRTGWCRQACIPLYPAFHFSCIGCEANVAHDLSTRLPPHASWHSGIVLPGFIVLRIWVP